MQLLSLWQKKTRSLPSAKTSETSALRVDSSSQSGLNVLASIPDEYKAKQIKELDLEREKLPLERALRVQWNIEKDTFIFRIALQDSPLTRRGILSVVSSIYDPLGFLAPFILKQSRSSKTYAN